MRLYRLLLHLYPASFRAEYGEEVPAVRAIIHRADPQQPITDVRPLTDIIDLQTASRAVQVRVLAGFALVAFLVAAIGIHGVLSFAVSQRTPEIGVRIALGAQRRDILSMVMPRWWCSRC